METLVVRRSLPKTALWFLAAFALAPLGATLALGGFGPVELPARILGWASVVCSLIGMARMGWQLLRTGPVLEIGPAGFHDHRLSAAPIPWAGITDFTVRGRPRQLLVAMPDQAVRQYLKPGLDARMSRLNKGIPITFIGLDHPFDEVHEAIQHWHSPDHGLEPHVG
jgi:hypothetical protein